MKRFEGKLVIVVGAAGKDNMGQCIARRFAGEGARVVVAGRHAEPLAHLASEIGGASRLCNFTRKEDIDALVAFARERYGRVDVGINATGWDFSGRSKTRVRKSCGRSWTSSSRRRFSSRRRS